MIRQRQRAVVAGLIVVAVFAGFWPALSLELMGDDYQWLQHAHAATHRPALLFADLDTFYRPASTWTLAVDRLLWGARPLGYHLSNLALQALAAIGLFFVAGRLGIGRWPAASVALLWACSPFTDEPAVSVAIRFENILLIAWLTLGLLWPGPSEKWNRRRVIGVAAATLFAAASKETWVVTPALVWALERGRDGKKPWKTAVPFVAAAIVYAAVYFLAFPTGKGYFRFDAAVLAKIPHQLAAFLYLEPFVPADFVFTWKAALAMLAVAALSVFAVRSAPRSGWFGIALLLAPCLPTLFVPYLPPRYTAIPYAGFLVLLAAAVHVFAGALSLARRRAFHGALAVLAAAVFAAGVLWVRADLRDYARISRAHARLLAQAQRVAPDFPLDRPVLVVRAERENPLLDIARTVEGTPKLLFVRHLDPSGLIDAAALFEWVLRRDGTLVQRWDDGATRFAATPGAVLVHHAQGFSWAAQGGANLATEAERWTFQKAPVRFVQAAISR